MSKFDPQTVQELQEKIDALLEAHNPHGYPHELRPMVKLAATLGWHSAAAVYQHKAVKDVSDLLSNIADAQQGFKTRGI